jgi:Uma2 family endonuclease
MSAAAKRYVTPEQYLEGERQSETRNEYFAGAILAMADSSPEHDLISRNTLALLWSQLRDKPCRVYDGTRRVRVTAELYAYPDITVVCGEARFEGRKRDVLVNPTLIVEVLSPTTEAWYRGRKFEQYRRRESLQAYLLVAPARPHIERFARRKNGQWWLKDVNGLEAILALPSIGGELALSEVYRNITFPEHGGRP